MNSNWTMAALIGGTAFLLSTFKYYHKIWGTENSDINAKVNEVLMYTGDEDTVSNESTGTGNLQIISDVVRRATRSLDICVPDLNGCITEQSLMVLNKGIKLRLIIHGTYDIKQIDVLKESIDIQIKTIGDKHKLGHEFLLVNTLDQASHDSVALIGALNYSNNNANSNYNNTIVTSEPSIIQKLKEEFERLWSEYEFENTSESTGANEESKNALSEN